MGFNCLKATEPQRGRSLLFTTKFPEIPGTRLIASEGWKTELSSKSLSSFEHRTPGLGIQHLIH